MRRLLVFLLVLGMGVMPVSAGPLLDSARRQYATPVRVYTTEMHSPMLFWTGATLVAGGTLAIIASLTFAQQSDLTREDPSTRLGRDLAPCGTDPAITRMPIADCKTNTGLQVFGILTSAGGGVLMAVGGQRVQIVSSPSRVGVRVRW